MDHLIHEVKCSRITQSRPRSDTGDKVKLFKNTTLTNVNDQGRAVDALALGGDEGRDKPR